MKTEPVKGFDCVAFKRKAQQALWREFEERRREFPSFAEFVRAKVQEDPWAREFWASVPERPRGQ